MRTVVAWLWIGASCAFQACGEALIVFFTYIMTKEGRDCVFGAFAPRLNLYGQRIFWGGLGVIFIMASIKIVITRVRVARFKKLESDNQMLTEKYEAGLSKLKDVERLVPNALKGILESLKSELALSLNARVSLYLVEMVKHLAFLVVSSLDPDVNDMEQSVIMQVVSTACQKLGAVINAFREFIPTPLMTQEQEGF